MPLLFTESILLQLYCVPQLLQSIHSLCNHLGDIDFIMCTSQQGFTDHTQPKNLELRVPTVHSPSLVSNSKQKPEKPKKQNRWMFVKIMPLIQISAKYCRPVLCQCMGRLGAATPKDMINGTRSASAKSQMVNAEIPYRKL